MCLLFCVFSGGLQTEGKLQTLSYPELEPIWRSLMFGDKPSFMLGAKNEALICLKEPEGDGILFFFQSPYLAAS